MLIFLINFSDDNRLNVVSFLVRFGILFLTSLVPAYIFVFPFRTLFIDEKPWIGFAGKSLILILAAIIMNSIASILNSIFLGNSVSGVIDILKANFTDYKSIFSLTLFWVGIFTFTQLYIQINDKYAPGIFFDIIGGKYKKPRVENKIVMFMDLTDSTGIAEKLGHQQYFLFIREFINLLSVAMFENGGTVYQYVGDEIVVSWRYSKNNARNALNSVISSRKKIQKRSEQFRRDFGIVPEFRVGIHAGDVTVGEIGAIKKDLAMSGDTMNTTARIRTACTELNQKYIISREFLNCSNLKEWQAEKLGDTELKGKAREVELYALKI